MQKDKFKELDRQAHRKLLVDNWHESSDSVSGKQSSVAATSTADERIEDFETTKNEFVIEWNLDDGDVNSADESQEGCGCGCG